MNTHIHSAHLMSTAVLSGHDDWRLGLAHHSRRGNIYVQGQSGLAKAMQESKEEAHRMAGLHLKSSPSAARVAE